MEPTHTLSHTQVFHIMDQQNYFRIKVKSMAVFYTFLLFSPALSDSKAWSRTVSRGKKGKAGKM